MSFLYRTTPLLRTTARPATRCFSTAVVYRKSATEAVKDGVKAVDRTISDAAVSGIDAGQELAGKAKDIAGINAKKADATASQVAGEAKGKAAELKGEAKGKIEEAKSKM